jgi:hypothetical protein
MIRELTDEEKQAQMQPEGCRMQVKLQKVDEERVCIDFIRVAGSSWYFFEQFKLIKEQLKEIDDAVL